MGRRAQGGTGFRTPAISAETRDQVARLYAEGLTLAQVAAQFSISDEAVRAAVVACGGAIRPCGRRPTGI